MDAQMITVVFAIVLAMGYIGRTVYLSLSGKSKGCGSGCGGCSSTRAAEPEASASDRRRIALPRV